MNWRRFRGEGLIKGITVSRPRIVREREPEDRMRWLTPDELEAFEADRPEEWWPLFATLAHTGMRIGEAQGLLWEDAQLREGQISIHEAHRRVKSKASVRTVAVSEPLSGLLARQSTLVP